MSKKRTTVKYIDQLLINDAKPSIYDNPIELEKLINLKFRETDSDLRNGLGKNGLKEYNFTGESKERRKQALYRIIPIMKDMLKDTELECCIEEELLQTICSSSATYDTINNKYNVVLAAALWILDRLQLNGRLEEAKKYFPKSYDQLDSIDLPYIEDASHSDEMIRSMIYIIENRNHDLFRGGECVEDKCKIIDKFTYGNNRIPNCASRDNWKGVLTLLPSNDIDAAVFEFEKKQLEWQRIYIIAADDLKRAKNSLKNRMEEKLKSLVGKYKEYEGKKTSLENVLIRNVEYKNLLQWRDDMHESIDMLDHEKIAIDERDDRYVGMSYKYIFLSQDEYAMYYGKHAAKLLLDYKIEDPYEVSFALIYLLDQQSLIPWNYDAGTAVINKATTMYPWRQMQDGYLSRFREMHSEDIVIKKFDMLDATVRFKDLAHVKQAGLGSFNSNYTFAQLVYEFTGVILPRYSKDYSWFRNIIDDMGITEEQSIELATILSIIGAKDDRSEYLDLEDNYDESSRNEQIVELYVDETNNSEGDADFSEERQAYLNKITELEEENKRIREELRSIRNVAYIAHRESVDRAKLIENLKHEGQAEHDELIALRNVVFAADDSLSETVTAKSSVKFPYLSKHEIVLFGGHDSWTKYIKEMLPNIRIVGKDVTPNPMIIRNADIIWIQPNCMSHGQYYAVINEVRRYNKVIRYLDNSSASKCAERIVEVDKGM